MAIRKFNMSYVIGTLAEIEANIREKVATDRDTYTSIVVSTYVLATPIDSVFAVCDCNTFKMHASQLLGLGLFLVRRVDVICKRKLSLVNKE